MSYGFFKTILTKKAKFVSGPFANMVFDIIEKQKKKLKIIVGNIVTVVPDNKNYLYQPVWYNFNNIMHVIANLKNPKLRRIGYFNHIYRV